MPSSSSASHSASNRCSCCSLATAFALLVTVATCSIARAATTQPAAGSPAPVPHGSLVERLQSLLGLVVFTFLAFGIGRLRGARTRVPTRTFVWGFILQFAFGAIVVWNRFFLVAINAAVDALLRCTAEGSKLVFGN